jgi:putative nucleotidyltransferase with HDIG domain
MSQSRRILFVDDERNVLDGLRRMLHPMRGQWKMEFVTRGEDALTAMQSHPYDVIISDLRMSGMDGLQLLEIVREKSPQTIRIMLSGYADQPLRTRASRCVHQFISKPCDADTLKKMVERALALYDRLHSTDLSDILSRLTSLPVLPKAYRTVLDLLNNPSCSLRRVGQVVAQDIGLSSKILQVVNNAFVTVQGQKIFDPIHAVSFLGFKASEALILTSGVFSELSEASNRRFCVDQLQEHCMRVGTLARTICNGLHLSEDLLDVASMAGILHDAGKMILISSFPDEYWRSILESRSRFFPGYGAERLSLQASHAELGGYLLDLWGLPSPIIEAVTYHHEPWLCSQSAFSVTDAIYIANLIDHQRQSSLADGWSEPINLDYLRPLGVTDQMEGWLRNHKAVLAEELAHVG